MKNVPDVSVLVWNVDGRPHLDACLSSLQAQTYPRNRFEVVLVDRGSADDSIAFVREKYAGTRVVGLTSKPGTGAGYNTAVRRCKSKLVAMLDSGTRVDPRWLSEMVSAAERHDAAAVASKILDWTGETIESAGTGMSFVGHSWPVDSGRPATRAYDQRPLLCADIRSALYARSAFLAAGGFDEDFGAVSADVDVGWRLNLFGGRVVLAPDAVAYRRPQDAPGWSALQRLRLQERNALAMIYKNYEADTLARVLPVAIALALMRGFSRSGIDTLALPMAVQPPESVEVTPGLVAHLMALEDFCHQLPALKAKRAHVQSRRRRSDGEIAGWFGEPLRLQEIPGGYQEIARALIRDFGLDEVFGPSRSRATGRPAVESQDRAEGGGVRPHATSQDTPKVSIVILTAIGPTHLRECLTSLRLQTYPADRIEVIVVDNGSADDPAPEAQRSYPGARVVRHATNLGFAAGNNTGAAVATGDYVVFLNDDTRVQPTWVFELVAAARRRGASAVASCIVDWSGERIDFVEGAVNFQGKGFQLEYDTPAASLTLHEKPLLFACGCAMLIDREVFVEAGRWDEDAFAYYEDVELGWRLNLLGHGVWFAPAAVAYHKHHGTSARWPEPPRLRLYERNSLRMLYRLLEPRSLERVLPAALLLAVERALLGSKLGRALVPTGVFRPGRIASALKTALLNRGITRTMGISRALKRLGVQGLVGTAREVLAPRRERSNARRVPYRVDRQATAGVVEPTSETLPIDAAAALAGLYGFLSDLPKLSADRADLQSRRRVADRDVVSQFREHWINPGPVPFQVAYNAVHDLLVREFAIENLSVPSAAGEGVEGCGGCGPRDTSPGVASRQDAALRKMRMDSGPFLRKSSSSNRTRR